MRRLILGAFCDMLHKRNLPPMMVLEHAAAALGAVYREVADAHIGPGACPCGWQPDALGDVARLQTALADAALSDMQCGLLHGPVAGHG
ncbi:hypothetical protein DVH29_00190 [Pelagibacterium lacus]|uniref:Uncharacterized protein n=2 Tax=Pelagibacterium lacus TaxID=2282655 RepID=A0A369W8J7_9HYPH|nr:hypothetical protein DVH29_00190 [Pelagibacterium lacus]